MFHTMTKTTAQILSFNEFYNAVNVGCSLLVNDSANIYHVSQADCDSMKKGMQAAEINMPPENGCRPRKNLLPTCSTDFLPADINQDNKVDASDYVLLRKSTGETYPLSSGFTLKADINKDGIVDDLDYQAWRNSFGQSAVLP